MSEALLPPSLPRQEVEYCPVESSGLLAAAVTRFAICLPLPLQQLAGLFVCLFVRITRRNIFEEGRSTLASFRRYTKESKACQLELEVRAWSSHIKTQAAVTVSSPHLWLSTSPSYVLSHKCFTVPNNTTNWDQPSKHNSLPSLFHQYSTNSYLTPSLLFYSNRIYQSSRSFHIHSTD